MLGSAGADILNFVHWRPNPKGLKGDRVKFVRERFVNVFSPFGPFFTLSPLLALLLFMAARCVWSASARFFGDMWGCATHE